MKKFMTWLDLHGEAAMIGTMVAAMSILMGMQVILRYVFQTSISWVEEVVVYFHIWCGFIGLSYCIRHNSDMRIDISNILPKKVASTLRWISDIILIAFYVYMAKAGVEVVLSLIQSGQKSPAAHIPMFLVYASIMVGCLLALLRFIQRIIRLSLARKDGKEMVSK